MGLNADIHSMVATALIFIQVMMIWFWLGYRRKKNAGIIDVIWPLSFILAAFVYLFLGNGNWQRSFLMTVMVLIWSLRLALHLYNRYQKNPEDPRHVRIKQDWLKHPDIKMLGLFIYQGILALLMTAPILISNINSKAELDFYTFLGFIIWGMGVIGESKADWTLMKFKENPKNNDEVCKEGLWRYSRHPNYFFEWVVWLGFCTFNLGIPEGWIAFYCPFLILHLLLNVSGVPLTELQLLHSKGEKYKKYQRRTSYFIPWWPREDVVD